MEAMVALNPIKPNEPANHDSATVIFGLAMTAVFVAMLVLNAIS
jgi:hypothetical protein